MTSERYTNLLKLIDQFGKSRSLVVIGIGIYKHLILRHYCSGLVAYRLHPWTFISVVINNVNDLTVEARL